MKRKLLKLLPLAMAMAGLSGLAHADAGTDSEGFHGYARVGAGTSSTGGPQSCYGLGGNTMKYRLGNECDAYTEFGYTKEIAKSEGVSYVATFWINAYSPKSDFGSAATNIAKAYVEAKGIDALNGGTAWIGKRYYVRPDIHMLDLQYINLNGTGGGIDQAKVGPGKFSYGFFKDNDANNLVTNTATPPVTTVTSTTAATRQNFVYQDVPVNTNGAIDIVTTVITAQKADAATAQPVTHNGYQVSLFHHQDKVFGGVNTLGLQYGVGPGTGIGIGNDRMGASGSTLLGSDVTRTRFFDEVWIQPMENFGMEAVALIQKDKSNAGSSTWITLGARPVYALSKNFKLVAELGTDRVTSSAATQRLTKFTFAPTISAGPGLWSRPELRAYVTYGKWNDAATPSVNASNNSGPVYNNGTSGTSYGVQLETWF